MFLRITGRLALSSALCESDLSYVIDEGYRTIIDLRSDDEAAAGGLRPAVERRYAAERHVAYYRIPVVLTSLESLRIDAVRAALAAATSPVLLHCANGCRAGLVALIHLGCQEGWSAAECAQRAPALGLDLDRIPVLRDVLLDYVSAHPDGSAKPA